ncbi:site-specific integrase, partial [Mesorhizobium sp. M7A.F.Ca.MR.362.00.0.0]|uniref:site-specific integrase n=1 Tax=Mesorhizobium sp. M7A.F.Ca.MR.362.00.0.0 TaxID=2496779 RepID=UPI0019D4269D
RLILHIARRPTYTERLFKHPRRRPYSAATKRHYTVSLTNVLAVLGNIAIRVLDEEKVKTYIKTKMKTGKTVQLRRDLAFLSTLMAHAREWDCGVEVNPLKLIDKSKIADANKRQSYVHRNQFGRLLAACKGYEQRLFVILGVGTGMRHQEIMKLHWDEVDLKRKKIQLGGERTKNSCPREIPLTQEVIDTLSDTLEAHRVGYVFKGKKEDEPQYNFAKRWAGIRKRAEMPNLHIHDLRHTFASWLIQSGVPEKTAQDLMGHKTNVMTQRYSHTNMKALRRAIEQMEADTL